MQTIKSCIFVVFFVQLLISIPTISGQSLSPEAKEEVKQIFKDEIESGKWTDTIVDKIDFEKEIQNYIDNQLDFGEEFKSIVGISIGGLIAIFVVIIIIPNLIILAFIFLCCYCCKCGAFYRGHDKDQNGPQTLAAPTYGGGYRPEVPARPNNQPRPNRMPDSPQPQTQSVWPWNRNQNQAGLQNLGYRNDY